MFVLSIKTGKKQVLSALACLALVAIVAVIALSIDASSSSASTGVPVVSTQAGTGEERVSFLKNLGYEIEEEATEVRELRLPDETDETISAYNELQKKIGFDLEAYLGKRVKVYTYRVLNDEEGSLAHLYVYRNKVIAGHLSAPDGEKPLM